MNHSKKIKLNLILPHILSANWSIEDYYMKDFIKKFGYWSWGKSKPALKIYINDFNIIGEQCSFLLYLDEKDCQCMFFAPYNNKTYRIEYGRALGKNIFLPFISSNSVEILRERDYSIFRLPEYFTLT